MRARVAAFAAALTACATSDAVLAPPPSRPASGPTPVAAPTLSARFFQAIPDEVYWVSHDAATDVVVSRGARFVLDSGGRVQRAAWERESSLLGCHALSSALGGGLLCWTTSELFRAADGTGPLTGVSLPRGFRGAALRGVRSAASVAVLLTDLGPLAVAPGALAAVPLAQPGVVDSAAWGELGVSLDVFGRASVRAKNAAALDVTPNAASLRSLFVTPSSVALESFEQRFVVGPLGVLSRPERFERYTMDPVAALATAFPGSRATMREDWPFGVRDLSVLQSVAASGAWLDDDHALGVVQGLLGRVELANGDVTHLGGEALPGSLPCEPYRAPDGVLVLCASEPVESYGSYVLRVRGDEPPALERAFSSEGAFVGGAHGALGLLGPCEAKLRVFDPAEERPGGLAEGLAPPPVLCLRTGPGAWVERRAQLAPDEEMLTWIPRSDGRAVALVRSRVRRAAELPPARDAASRREEGPVTVVRVPSQLEGQVLARDSARSLLPTRLLPRLVDRSFAVREDGSLVGWVQALGGSVFGPSEGPRSSFHLAPNGVWTLSLAPSGTRAMVLGGPYALALDGSGRLHESRDFGFTWADAGPSPVSEASFHGVCSALGCVLDDVVRFGWGSASVDENFVSRAPLAPAPVARDTRPRLVCAPRGEPSPRVFENTGDGLMAPTSWGEPLGVEGLSIDPQDGLTAPDPAHFRLEITLHHRAPFDTLRVRHSVRVAFDEEVALGQLTAWPLVDGAGHVSTWLPAGAKDVWLDGARGVVSAAPDPGRGAYFGEGVGSAAGLLLGAGRALVPSWTRRRFALETRGTAPLPPAQHVGLDLDVLGRRQLLLGREGEAIGLLVLDGFAPDTAGVAPWDPVSGAVGALQKLAPWSTLSLATSEACRREPGGHRVLVPMEPAAWLRLDGGALPGVDLGSAGLALARWSSTRVCLEGLHALVTRSPRGEGAARIVARWPAPAGAPEVVLASDGLETNLVCHVEPP